MTAQEAVAFLAERRRTVLLGGMAVILYGLNRNTKDYDIWMDPLPEPKAWAVAIQELMRREPSLQARRIDPLFPRGWTEISMDAIADVGGEDKLVRIVGADRPIDIFYRPNELEVSDFEEVWTRSTLVERGVRLMEKIDLIVTKQLTDRLHDLTDVKFLSGKIEEEYRARLIDASEQEAREMFARFATPEIAGFAFRESRDKKVRELGWKLLEEMRAGGDPFAEELVQEIRRQKLTPEQDQELGHSL